MQITSKSHYLFLITSVALLVIVFAILTMKGPIPQPSNFHLFADQRPFLGVPNAADVISNIPFALFGIMGLWFLSLEPLKLAHRSWFVFFAGVALVAPGSAFYHLDPNNYTLVWDRLPMTFSFMAVFSALLTELFWENFEKYFLIPLVAIGIFSVTYWYWTETLGAGDLRLYALVQGYPLLIIPFAFWFGDKKYTHYHLVLISLGFYVLAKVAENYDLYIFNLTGEIMSGHTLKHLLASLGAFTALHMLRSRKRLNN